MTPAAAALFRRLFDLPRPTFDIQRRGLGTALLRTMICTARDNGMHRLSGELMPKDVANFAGLADWYSREGFVVSRENGRTFIELSVRVCLPR